MSPPLQFRKALVAPRKLYEQYSSGYFHNPNHWQ
jgi:hypothetical protein